MQRNLLALGWSAASAIALAFGAAAPMQRASILADAQARAEQDEPDQDGEPDDQNNADQADQEKRDAPPQRDVTVVLNSGQRLRGTLVDEQRDHIVLRIANIETRVPRAEVDRVITRRPLLERYRSMREAIDDDDVDRLLPLIEWMRANGLLDQALEEIQHVLEIEPNNGRARRLRRLIEQQVALRDKTEENRKAADAEQDAGGGNERPGRFAPGEFPLLSESQVNLVKVYEIDLDDPPPIVIDRETVDELLEEYGDHPDIPVSREGRQAFHRKPPLEILKTMFRLRARELYSRVRVRKLPESLRRFRDHVNATWLVNACATTRCHGGTEAGRLALYNRDPRTERSAVTNFMILDRFHLDDGTPMINYETPQRSPLLQMTLPREESAFPHPEVYGWRPVFRELEARRLQQAVEWIKSMHRPRLDYPIAYEPPRPPKPQTADAEKAPDR